MNVVQILHIKQGDNIVATVTNDKKYGGSNTSYDIIVHIIRMDWAVVYLIIILVIFLILIHRLHL